MTDALRPYQVDIVADVEREIAAGKRRILLVAPTGSGKTVIAGEIITAPRDAIARFWCWRIGWKSSRRPARSYYARGHPARHHQGRILAATDGAGAARLGADPVGARHALGGDAAAARRSADHR